MEREVIRVAMIIQGYHPLVGGAERQLVALIPHLRDFDVDVHIITRRYTGLKAFELIDGVPVHRLPIPGPKALAASVFSLAAMPLVRTLAPQLIHAHELLSPTTTAILAKRLFGIPIVVKVLRGGSIGDLAKLHRKPFGMRRIAASRKWVDAFVTISQEIDAELDEIGVDAARRPLIPNGVDVDRFRPLPDTDKKAFRAVLELPVNGSITIFSGRLAPEKRVNHLLTVWQEVRKKHPDATLLILGVGAEEATLKKMAGDGVHFLGLVDDVAPYLQAADLFVLPSVTEGLSNALLEALAAGVPAIATSVGGAPDLIQHQANGWLIPPDDVPALQDAVLSLLGDPALRLRFSDEGRKKVLQDYSLQATAEKLRTLYESYISR